MSSMFLMPQYIVSGENALDAASEKIKEFGKRALIVTDNVMVKIGNLDKLTQTMSNRGIEYEVYSEVNSEPTDIIVNNGLTIYKEKNCDFLIALGGGSPIDTMKAIGAMVTNPGKITDYIGKIIPNKTPAMVAIPTTAGTGSEATQFTIIADTTNNIKMLLKGPYIMPTLAVVDPFFTLSSPKGVTSATGLDALTHAIEAYTSRKAQSLSDIFAISAVKRIFNNLFIAYEDGSNIEARKEMSIAALEAGIAFNNSSVTIVHGMSRPIGALFHVPHGLSNAMLLSECLKFALDGAVERFCELSKAIGVYEDKMSSEEGAKAFINAVEQLCNKLNVMTLKEFGVDEKNFIDNIDKMAFDALQSGSPQNTMKLPNKEDIINIYKSVWEK